MTTPRRALIIIDVQQEYFAGPLEIQYPPHAESLPNILEAIDAAVQAKLPVVAFQHTAGRGAPVFDPTKIGFELHPGVAERREEGWGSMVKQHGSVFAATELAPWLRQHDVDTITLVGYMTNNCVLASSVEAEGLGIGVEVLADATGAVSLANDAGFADAETVHRTLMALLQSNWAAVADTQTWTKAVRDGQGLPKSDLGSSAVDGAQKAAQATSQEA